MPMDLPQQLTPGYSRPPCSGSPGRATTRRSGADRLSVKPSNTNWANTKLETPMIERTLVLIKPDAVRRGLVGELLGRFERKGLTIDALLLRTMDATLADQHYAEHVDKGFYPPL